MKKLLFTLLAAAMMISASAQQKVLVAYFSFTNNTKAYAEKITAITGGDLYEIVPQIAYGSENSNYYDETCLLHEKIFVSAGQRGMQLRLSPQDLINYVPLTVSDLI